MERHFHEELQTLKNDLVHMAGLVEEALCRAIDALIHREDALAIRVIEGDKTINAMEIKIDEYCLKLLALQQPMAVDLRFITSAIKINNDLERIGDHAVNIAERVRVLNQQEPVKPILNLPRMAEITQSMVADTIDSFVNRDVEKARAALLRDDKVDQYDDQIFRELLTYMMDDTHTISRAINLVLISKNIERIADLSTNIAEEVIFIYEARNIKHGQGKAQDIRSRS